MKEKITREFHEKNILQSEYYHLNIIIYDTVIWAQYATANYTCKFTKIIN